MIAVVILIFIGENFCFYTKYMDLFTVNLDKMVSNVRILGFSRNAICIVFKLIFCLMHTNYKNREEK